MDEHFKSHKKRGYWGRLTGAEKFPPTKRGKTKQQPTGRLQTDGWVNKRQNERLQGEDWVVKRTKGRLEHAKISSDSPLPLQMIFG